MHAGVWPGSTNPALYLLASPKPSPILQGAGDKLMGKISSLKRVLNFPPQNLGKMLVRFCGAVWLSLVCPAPKLPRPRVGFGDFEGAKLFSVERLHGQTSSPCNHLGEDKSSSLVVVVAETTV